MTRALGSLLLLAYSAACLGWVVGVELPVAVVRGMGR